MLASCAWCRRPINRDRGHMRIDRGAQVAGTRLMSDREFCSKEHYARWVVARQLEVDGLAPAG